MFWIQVGRPHLTPEFSADPHPVYDLDELIWRAYPLLAEEIIFVIDYQLYRLAYQDLSSWIQELVPFLNQICQGQGSHTSLYDQSGFDSKWTVRPKGKGLHVHVEWVPPTERTGIDFLVNREHFLREWKGPLMRVREDLAPFARLLEKREDWEALVRLTDEIEGRGTLYGGTPEWELPEV